MSTLTLNSQALTSNIQALTDIDPNITLGVCVKADGYSHAAKRLVEIINGDVKYVFVGTPQEAFNLNQDPSFKVNNQILMVMYTFTKEDLMRLANNPNVIFNICDLNGLQLAIDYCNLINQGLPKENKQKVKFSINIDTGMHFLGFELDQFHIVINQLLEARDILEVFCLNTHFATADCDNTYYFHQFELFDFAISYFIKNGVEFEAVSYHNSASLLAFPTRCRTDKLQSLGQKYHKIDIARAGIAVYGYYPSRLIAGIEGVAKLKPILSWHSKVASIKTLIPGSYLGYNCNYKTQEGRYTTIAIVPVGYYEGFDRRLSNRGSVLIDGHQCAVVSNVRMNSIAVNITGLEVSIGDEVIIIDSDLTADDLAYGCDTINYEILTGIKG
jgi:alanine racemase